jgi:hypothetical protein
VRAGRWSCAAIHDAADNLLRAFVNLAAGDDRSPLRGRPPMTSPSPADASTLSTTPRSVRPTATFLPQALLNEALGLSLAAHSTRNVTLCLAAFTELAFAEGDAERAALLAGVAEGLRRCVEAARFASCCSPRACSLQRGS